MSSPPAHLFVPLIFLQDPPDDYHLDGADMDKWRVVDWKAIVDYHGYGFAYDLPLKVVKADLINVFRKIAYNIKGPKAARCSGDVGSGLLKDGILAGLGLAVHAAQWTVTEADTRNYFTIPDHLLRAPVSKAKRSNDPISIKPTSGFPTITFASPGQSQGRQQGPQKTELPLPNTQRSSSPAPSTLSRAEVTLTETIIHDLVNSSYCSLARHEAAFPLTHRPFLDASSTSDLRQLVNYSHPASATIKLTWTDGETQCTFDPKGSIHTYHGKGPVWSNNSCWMDSVIVAGMLLDAGSTIADRGGEANWEQSLNVSGQMYLDALSMNWDGFTEADSIIYRDLFRKSYTDHYNKAHSPETKQLTMNSFHAPAIFWEDVAQNFHQFRYKYERRSGCACSPDKVTKSKPRSANSISQPLAQTKSGATSMQNLMQATFVSQTRCPQCERDEMFTRRVVHDDLPLRLAVIPNTNPSLTMPLGHTDDISFEYDKIAVGQEATVRSTAVYRWLGGVYYSPDRHHFRVYWTNDERGEPRTNGIRVYDGQVARGAIIGNFTINDNTSNKLDREWTTRPANLLFYERIVFPTAGALQAVTRAVTDIQRAKSNDDSSLILRKPRVQPRKQPIYRRSLQPYIFQDAEYSAMRTSGLFTVPLEQKDFLTPPEKASAVPPEPRILSTPPSTAPTKPRTVGKYMHTGDSGTGTDPVVLSSDDEETMPTPSSAPTNLDATRADQKSKTRQPRRPKRKEPESGKEKSGTSEKRRKNRG